MPPSRRKPSKRDAEWWPGHENRPPGMTWLFFASGTVPATPNPPKHSQTPNQLPAAAATLDRSKWLRLFCCPLTVGSSASPRKGFGIGPESADHWPKVGAKLTQSCQSRPNIGPKLTQSRPKVGTKSAQSRPKVGTKSVQSRPKVSPKSAKSTQSRPKEHPKSTQVDRKSAQSQHKVGQKSTPSWPRADPKSAQNVRISTSSPAAKIPDGPDGSAVES